MKLARPVKPVFIRLFLFISLCITIACCSESSLFGAAEFDISLDNTIIDRIIEDINQTQAGGEIKIYQFVFSDKKLVKPLIAAHNRGATIEVNISPKLAKFGQKEVHQKLIDAGISVRYIPTHEKIIIIKPDDETNSVAYFGSRNFSNKAYWQPEITERITDQDTIAQILAIEAMRERKEPLPPLSPVKRKKDAPDNRLFNTPKKGEKRAIASETLSPGSVLSGPFRAMRDTPPTKKARSSPRQAYLAIMNVNNRATGATPRLDLLAEMTDAAQRHTHTKFELLLDAQTAEKENLQVPLATLQQLRNVQVKVHNPDPRKSLGATREIFHPKVAIAGSLVADSSGNATAESVSEPNLSLVSHVESYQAKALIKQLQAIPSRPFVRRIL